MVATHGTLRMFVALTVALSVGGTHQSQVPVITRDHSCSGESPCEWDAPACETAWRPGVSAVFLGRATEIREEDVPIVLDGKNALTVKLFVKFEVEEGFLGVPEKNVTVVSGGDLCGFPFSKGREYLVYGRRLESGEIHASICSFTKWKSEATEDLQYLRNLSVASHGGTIYGTAYLYIAPAKPRTMGRMGTAATGQKIRIQGANQSYEATVDARGSFTISALPPGRYIVSVNSNNAVISSPPHLSPIVDLADKGCAKFNFWIDPFAKKDPPETPRGANTPPATDAPTAEHPD